MSGTQTSTSAPAVTPGNWILQSINGMQYEVLLPANYNPSIEYSTTLYLHQLDMGTDVPGLLAEVDPWFNTVAFRSANPTIIVMPLLDQTADPSGQTINFGGVSTADSTGEMNAIAALKRVMAQYSTDPTRTYVTGNSMGGIGTEDMLIKYNAYTGTEGKIFTAGLALAGADYGQGYPQPDASVVTALKNVPFWAIHGGQDTTVPLAFDQNLYAAEQAIGGDMKYTRNNSLGHDVWGTYYTQTGASSPLGWLYSQSTGGAVTGPTPAPVPTVTSSANDTVVTGTMGSIVDASGNTWTISSGGQVAVNGVADATTAGVVELAYVNGTIWQENASKLWWGETQPNASWAPAVGTATSPLPAAPTPTASPNDTMVLAGATTAIADASGNRWTIAASGQVAVNGAIDATTANVTQLVYANKEVWQQNASNLWWVKSSPAASWVSGADPLPAPVVIAPGTASATVTQSQVSIAATTGSHMLFLSGSGDIVSLSGGTDTVTDPGGGNTYILPVAGKGTVAFAGNILSIGDTLDLKTALAATKWTGSATTLSKFLTVTDSAAGATLSVSTTSGGSGVAIASIHGATTANLTSVLAHSIT